MEIAIIGLPKCGKTTVFNALTRSKAEVTTYLQTALIPNIGIAKVPESRLILLEKIFQPKKIVPAEVKYVDIVSTSKKYGKSEGITGQFLNYLSNADALIHIVRDFENANVPHIDNIINPKRDLSLMDIELVFSDLTIIGRRLEKLEISLKGAKSSDRDLLIREQNLLNRIKKNLEKEIPLWQQGLAGEEIKSISHYQFLTAKPVLVIINIDERKIGDTQSIETELRSIYQHRQFEIIALCGKLEMELIQLNEMEAEEFRKALNIQESALERVIKSSYKLMGLISFFTTVSSELKVWTIPQGTVASKAAGKIHTDIEKGFIRAEVFNCSDLEKHGTLTEIRKLGLLRQEGKNYIVQDGDVITFLFNV